MFSRHNSVFSLFLLSLIFLMPMEVAHNLQPQPNKVAEQIEIPNSLNNNSSGGIFEEDFLNAEFKSYTDNAVWDTMNGELRLTPKDDIDQTFPDVASISSGAHIIVWKDFREGNYNYYAQKIDGQGNRLWAEDVRINLGEPGSNSSVPRIACDSSGNAFIVWSDNRTGDMNVYAQRIDTDGNILWPLDIVINKSVTGNQKDPAVAVDNTGKALIVWDDDLSGHAIMAQLIKVSGLPTWSDDLKVNTVPVQTEGGNISSSPQVAGNANGQMAVSWGNYKTIDDYHYYEFYAQYLSLSGTRILPNEILVGTGWRLNLPLVHALDMDINGNIYIAWTNGNYDVMAQKISPSGSYLWPSPFFSLPDPR